MTLTDPGIGARHGIGQVGVMDPDGASSGSQSQVVLECSRSVAGWGEFGVTNPGVLVCSRSVARWCKFRVADPGVFGVQSKHSRMGRVRGRRPRRFVS